MSRFYAIELGGEKTYTNSPDWHSMEDFESVMRSGTVYLIAFDPGEHDFCFPQNPAAWLDEVIECFRNGQRNPSINWSVFEAWARSCGLADRLYEELQGLHVEKPSKSVGPRKPVPALPPEAHATKEFDPNAAWDAVVALSKGN